MKDKFVMGIDAGGTKTDVCVADLSGKIIKQSAFAGINASRMGVSAAAKAISACVPSEYEIDCMYAGIAGAGRLKRELAEELRGILNIPRIEVESDAFNALNGEVGLGDGIALIAGTGSSAFVRKNGAVRQVGSAGYLIDDAGSAYSVGRAALNTAFRCADGRGEQTSLVKTFENHFGMPLAEAVPTIYNGGVALIASLAPLVEAEMLKGDSVARAISENAVNEIFALIKSCDKGMICVASGGMFRSDYIKSRVTEMARGIGIEMVFPVRPPVFGAVRTAILLTSKC